MQTTSHNILSFDASIAGGVKQQNSNQNSDENSGEFLSMVLEAAANRGEKLNEQDMKDLAKSANISVQKNEPISNTKSAVVDVKEILGDKADTLFTNATFMQLLQILEMLNGGEKLSKFPNFSSQLAKALSNEAMINELRGAKNVSELLQIAKKLNLGLEKITITKEQVGELNLKFPALAKNGFFNQITPNQNPIFNAELKAKVENATKQNAAQDEPVRLNNILKELSKDSLESKNQPNLNQNSVAKDVKFNPQNEIKNVNLDENALKTNATQNVQKELSKTESQKMVAENLNLKATESTKGVDKASAKINLQSLLYPEREQSFNENSQNSGENSGQNSESELNSMVREIMQNAKAQSKNLQAVRQTFDNFNATLKEQVEAYKSPFMRFNITLNPLNLGEVEITMVNRGNNLHINFNSNTQTMNLFLQNQAEFKNSLVNMGFTELEMNFSDQNQKKEQGGRAYKGSKFDANEMSETMEQPLLEIVLPRYI